LTNPIRFLPSLGMSGYYSLSAPYNALLSSTSQYTCSGIMSIAGAEAQGIDVLTNVYLANGDTLDNYTAAKLSDMMLVSVSAGTGDVFTFPVTALIGVPSGEGIIYRNQVLSIGLSAIPATMDLTALQTEISNLVYNTLGVKSVVYVTAIGAATILTPAQDSLINAARAAAITTPSNTLYKNSILTQQNSLLTDKVSVLEAYIKAHFIT